MATEIVLVTEDRPGVLADVGELIGTEGVNITAAAAFTHEGKGFIHLIVDDVDAAIKPLEDAGYMIAMTRDVLVVTLDDEPGALGAYARRLADAEVNVLSLYTGGGKSDDKELIIAVDKVPVDIED